MINRWTEMTDFQNKMNGASLEGAPLPLRITLARQMCNALFMEVAELQDSFSWKPWRKDNQVLDRENLKREMVDCIFFLHHIGECFGITPAELNSKFDEVMTNNIKRYHDGDFSSEEENESQHLNTLERINAKLDQLINGDFDNDK